MEDNYVTWSQKAEMVVVPIVKLDVESASVLIER